MKRSLVILFALALSFFAAVALVLNLAAPDLACRLYLCPESTLLRLARENLLRGDAPSLAASIRLYRLALARDPASPYRWCDLADALLASGDISGARDCFSKALQFGPNIPQTLLRVAGFYFRQGQTRPALQTMARILALTPAYDGLLFSYYDRMDAGLAEVLNYGIPPDPRPAQSYFRHLLRNAPLQDAGQAWAWLGARGWQEDSLAGDYVARLLRARRFEDASSAWAEYAAARGRQASGGNLVFNGGFEYELARCPLDWNVSPVAGAEVARDGGAAHSGRFSLRIDFGGKKNLQYRHVFQRVCVRPGPLRFRAFVKAAGLTTDQGVGFCLFDAESPARLNVRTEQLLRASDWRPLELAFVAPAETRLLMVQVCRDSSLKFDNAIRGSVWIDDVSLVSSAPRM